MKTIIITILMILVIVLAGSTIHYAKANSEASKGDLNHDGTVNIFDLSKLEKDYSK